VGTITTARSGSLPSFLPSSSKEREEDGEGEFFGGLPIAGQTKQKNEEKKKRKMRFPTQEESECVRRGKTQHPSPSREWEEGIPSKSSPCCLPSPFEGGLGASLLLLEREGGRKGEVTDERGTS